MKKKLSVSIVGEDSVDTAMASSAATAASQESKERDAKKETSGPFEPAAASNSAAAAT